jgi:hypothetical protein
MTTPTRQEVYNGQVLWNTDLSSFPGGIAADSITTYSQPYITFGTAAFNTVLTNQVQPLTSAAVTIGAGRVFGGFYWDGNGTSINCNSTGNYVPLATTYTVTATSGSLTTVTNSPGQIAINASRTRSYNVTAQIDAFTGVSSVQFGLAIGINGVFQNSTVVQAISPSTTPGAGSTASLKTSGVFSLAAGVVLTVMFTINTGTNFNLTAVNGSLSVYSIDND